jgi:hypothetical protein
MLAQKLQALLLFLASVAPLAAVETQDRQSYPLAELPGYLAVFDEPPLPSLLTKATSIFRFTSIACTLPPTVVRIETFKDRKPARITVKWLTPAGSTDGKVWEGRVRTEARDMRPRELEEFRNLFAQHNICRELVTKVPVFDAPDWTFEFANSTRHCATLKRPLVDESYQELVTFLMQFAPRVGGELCG